MVTHHILTLWTNDPALAAEADAAGVDRLGLDLEKNGKAGRQRGRPTWISPHRQEDLGPLRDAVQKADLFVRCNPLHDGSAAEVDDLIARGVAVLMLPNFTETSEVDRFVALVGGRARIVPLLERTAAESTINAMSGLGIDEIHFGLNDLSIDLGLPNSLSVLASPFLHRLCQSVQAAGLQFGVGGLARANDNSLPVPSDLVYAQQPRLGSMGALLARSFMAGPRPPGWFAHEIRQLRQRLGHWQTMPATTLEQACQELQSQADRAA